MVLVITTLHGYGYVNTYDSGEIWVEDSNEFGIASAENLITVINKHYSYQLNKRVIPVQIRAILELRGDFWLASKCWNLSGYCHSFPDGCQFLVRYVGRGHDNDNMAVRDWYRFSRNYGGVDYFGPEKCGVCPIVELDGDLAVEDTDIPGNWYECDKYNLK